MMVTRKLAVYLALLLLVCGIGKISPAPVPPKKSQKTTAAHPTPKRNDLIDDSLALPPARDLNLSIEGGHKAEALAHFAEGIDFEEDGEMEKALEAYRQVLNVDPGQIELAVRVAALLTRDDDYPSAIDVLKDAVKVHPKAPEPYLELSFIYAKYLKKGDQAIEFANKAIALDPQKIDGYQRLFEIYLTAGEEKRALETLDRAAKMPNDDPTFWARLGRLYGSVILKPDAKPNPEQTARLNDVFEKAAAKGQDNAAVLKEVGDYFASTQQIKEALPFYLRVLELQPDDANVREKLATGFVLTNQRARAVETLEAIIQEHPEKYQSYELLAQLHDDEGRALVRANQTDPANAEFKKAAQNYEQSLLINPNHAGTYLRLAELLLVPLKQSERAVSVLTEGRRRYPDAPEFAYYLAIALRESKKAKDAVIMFEEALNEAQNAEADFLKPRFYVEYGAAAQEAGLYDKAAELFHKAIAMDPANAAEPYNYLGYMWAEQNSHLDEAEDAIKRALQLDPENGAYLDSMAWVEYRQGKYDQALENLKRAIENLPREDAVVFEHLGDVYLKLNRVSQALESWQKAKTLDPSNKDLAAKIEGQKTRVSKTNPTGAKP
ncbi:MAG TPA: tetratricopeptide repeat protein [Chthoniobacterales bacterium]|nr:tetratricopeptide repeat protein [Chthoniobacterales bacterium]